MFLRVAIVVLASSLPVFGEDVPQPWEPGTRLRLTLDVPHHPHPRVGVCGGVQGGHLIVGFDDGSSRRIPLAAVRRLEVSRGRRPSVLGAVLGASLGGAVGALAVGCLANRDDYGVPCGGQDDTKFLVGGIVGGLAGGALGALVGRHERWDEVELQLLEDWAAQRRARAAPSGPAPPGPGRQPRSWTAAGCARRRTALAGSTCPESAGPPPPG